MSTRPLRHVPVRHCRIEVLFELAKEGAKPNGLQFDAKSDRLFIADQGDGSMITVSDPRGNRKETIFATDSQGPSGITVMPWNGEEAIVMSSTYGRALTFIRGEKVTAVDCRGVGVGIVAFAADHTSGTQTGYHGLEFDGQHLWAVSPPGQAVFRIELKPNEAGQPRVVGCSWFSIAFGDRPHGMAWADPSHRTAWCNDTTIGTIYRYDVTTGQCLEILVLPVDAPQSHGMTIVNGEIWYCEDTTAKIVRVIPEV
ncbi:MAG: hypothetical protein VX733_09095 [Candidatus Latescibacterota bacterium]|nr:hypothetical protein [Candidatus Latescibacterota bacterium]